MEIINQKVEEDRFDTVHQQPRCCILTLNGLDVSLQAIRIRQHMKTFLDGSM